MTPDQKICIRCQECCNWMTFIVDKSIIDLQGDYYIDRGCTIKHIPNTDKYGIMIPYICPHLTRLGCNIYSTRSKACRDYNGRTDFFLKEKCKWR